jgi:L-fucose mutarotase
LLKTKLLHPDILRVLAGSGHFSQVLIADGNFPVLSHSGPNAAKVFLNLTAGIPKATDVLAVLVETIPIQDAAMMQIPNGEQAPILDDYREMLPSGLPMRHLERYAFYDAVRSPLTSLVIATGETRRFANLLLTIGVVKLDRSERY